MKNTFILSCLFLASFISASKPLPAAGAGAAAQSPASQVDVKAIQEKHDKNKKALAQLVAEMHQVCGSVLQRKELLEGHKSALLGHTNHGWLLRYSIPTAKDEWIDEQMITTKNSSTLIITTHYSLNAPVASTNIDVQGNVFPKLIHRKKSFFSYKANDHNDLAQMFIILMNDRIENILNLLSINGQWQALSLIINNGTVVLVDF